MTWLEHTTKPPYWVGRIVGTDGDTQGNGLGDIDMDGRLDIITGQGWYRQPDDPRGPWPFHTDWEFRSALSENATSTAHPDIVHDVNEDGLNDVIIRQCPCLWAGLVRTVGR